MMGASIVWCIWGKRVLCFSKDCVIGIFLWLAVLHVKTCILTVKSTRSAKYSGEPNSKPNGDNGDNTVPSEDSNESVGLWACTKQKNNKNIENMLHNTSNMDQNTSSNLRVVVVIVGVVCCIL